MQLKMKKKTHIYTLWLQLTKGQLNLRKASLRVLAWGHDNHQLKGPKYSTCICAPQNMWSLTEGNRKTREREREKEPTAGRQK